MSITQGKDSYLVHEEDSFGLRKKGKRNKKEVQHKSQKGTRSRARELEMNQMVMSN